MSRENAKGLLLNLNPEEFDLLTELSNVKNMTKSEVLRQALRREGKAIKAQVKAKEGKR